MTAYICSDVNCGWFSADKDQATALKMKCFWCESPLEKIDTPFNRSVKLTDKEQRDDTLLRRLLGYGGGVNLPALKKTKLITSIRLLQDYAETRSESVDELNEHLKYVTNKFKTSSMWQLYIWRQQRRKDGGTV